jgi:hypothetical protein
MLRALEVAGLQDMVLGNEVEPNDPALLRKWKRKNVIALSALSTNTTRKVHLHINDKDTAKDAWDSLCTHYEKKLRVSQRYLRTKWNRLVQERGVSIDDHIMNAKAICNELNAAGLGMSEHVQVSDFLYSLRDEFHTVVTQINSQLESTPDLMTWDYITPRLLNEEQYLQVLDQRQSTLPHNAVLAVKGPSQGAVRFQIPPRASHDQKQYVLPEKQLLREPNRENRTCYPCGVLGHVARYCPQREQPPQGRFARQARFQPHMRVPYRHQGNVRDSIIRTTIRMCNLVTISHYSAIRTACMILS